MTQPTVDTEYAIDGPLFLQQVQRASKSDTATVYVPVIEPVVVGALDDGVAFIAMNLQGPVVVAKVNIEDLINALEKIV